MEVYNIVPGPLVPFQTCTRAANESGYLFQLVRNPEKVVQGLEHHLEYGQRYCGFSCMPPNELVSLRLQDSCPMTAGLHQIARRYTGHKLRISIRIVLSINVGGSAALGMTQEEILGEDDLPTQHLTGRLKLSRTMRQ
jgi:hypothetical protein